MNNMHSQLNGSTLTGYSVKLLPVAQQDLALLFNWRNEKSIREQMVDQKLISFEQHQQWFNALSSKKAEQHFVIYYKNDAIGVINIKTVQTVGQTQGHENGEVGLYIANENYKGNIVAFAPSLVINDLAFEQLKLKRLSSKVRADNFAALKYNQQLGYQLAPEENGFIAISLTADNYHKTTKSLKQFLSRGNKLVNRAT